MSEHRKQPAFARWFGQAEPPAAAAEPEPDELNVVEYERPRWPFSIGTGWRLPSPSAGQRRLIVVACAAVAAVLIAGGVLAYRVTHRPIGVTAYFSQSIGIYPGSTVRVLGVTVGRVDSTRPEGTRVKVTMTIDRKVAIPANAKAIVVTSGVVADRYIQFAPAYTGGPQMADGAVIPVGRTAVPLEVDQIYTSLGKFFDALGPSGVNKTGALSSLVKTGAASLAGNGKRLAAMITEFSALNRELGGSSGDFFATVANLNVFSSVLKKDDSQVRLAEQQLATVSGFLASDREDLAGALSQLATALGQVRTFIASNRALIKSNVGKLASVTKLLVTERDSLAQALSSAPLALDNLLNAYDSANKSLVGRGDLNELSMGKAAKIFATDTAIPADAAPVAGTALTNLPPLPLPAVGTVYGTKGGR
ncbi:MAG TPA: MCE family protein [Streptosporangiaceae bacterium]|nr:MCE family protein [Streptosporangiaceae bacterium]